MVAGYPSDSTTFTIDVKNGGSVVASLSHPVYICGPGDEFTNESSEPMFSRFEFSIVNALPVRTVTWSSPQTIRVGGTVLGVGNSVVIREGTLPLLDSVDSLTVIAGGFTQLRYLDEQVLPVIPLPAQSSSTRWLMAALLLSAALLAIRRRTA